jgi:hypothetical protein
MSFEFKCNTCGQTHQGMPSFGALAPHSYYRVVEDERATRCRLGSDDCVIDEQFFFVRGCVELPVKEQSEPFTWGVWVSLSETSFDQWAKNFESLQRARIGPFFGWLDTALRPYPDTLGLKTRVHLRDAGMRPRIELEPTDHALALEQRGGISVERVAEMYALMVHADAHP